MYEFHIERKGNKEWKFERDGVKIITDEYVIKDGKHLIVNPLNSIAYFYVDDNIFAFRNRSSPCTTVEDFFDLMLQQIALLKRTA